MKKYEEFDHNVHSMLDNPPRTPLQIKTFLLEYRNKIIRQDGPWIKGHKEKFDVEYNLNSVGLRSDNFKTEHDKKHILFAGCSNTFGVGTDYDKIWTQMVYQDISKNEELDGYYNVGINGSTIIEIIFQTCKYIEKYGAPDTIFMLLPEVERDDNFFIYPEIYTDVFVSRVYGMFEMLCKGYGINLLTTSWVFDFPSLWDILLHSKKSVKEEFPNKLARSKVRNEDSMFDELNDNYESFLPLDPNQFINDIYEYSLKNQDDPNLYVAKDSGRHFGSAIHYAWKEHFMRRYNDKETN
jgi:hypothetical protein